MIDVPDRAAAAPPGADDLDAVFSKNGFLSRAIAGYTPRPGQIAFARACQEAVTGPGHLLAEAGCGCGKSFAYLTPIIRHLHRKREAGEKEARAVIASANIALQEQIVWKDLPTLARALPWHASFGLLKGRSHYLCLSRYYKDVGEQWAGEATWTADQKKHLHVVREWAKETVAHPEDEIGDVSELPFEDHEIWRRFSVTADECKGPRCKHHRTCFALRAQREAKEKQIVVTNYHLLFSDLAVRRMSDGAGVLPPYQTLVMDEIQAAAGISRAFFGWQCTRETLRRLVAESRLEDPSLSEQFDPVAKPFFHAMAALRSDRVRHPGYVKELNDDAAHTFDALRSLLRAAWTRIDTRSKRLRKDIETQVRDDFDAIDITTLSDRQRQTVEEVADLEMARDKLEHHGQNLVNLAEPWAQDGSQIYYVDEDRKGAVTLASKLVDPGPVLRSTIFARDEFGPVRGVIGCSATVCIGKNDFTFAARELGVPLGYSWIVAQSPFRFSEQAMLIVPTDDQVLHEPTHPQFKNDLVRCLRTIIGLAQGRTLGLFTSYANLHHAYDSLFAWCKGYGWTLYKQGDAPRTELVRRFREDTSSCLFGTESFWAGIDVPGETLSVVVIDKIPFPNTDDPIAAALRQRRGPGGADWFYDYSLPRAAIQLKQGAGRLIRSHACHGAVVCLDKRLREKSYGRLLLAGLPKMKESSRLSDLADWLARKEQAS